MWQRNENIEEIDFTESEAAVLPIPSDRGAPPAPDRDAWSHWE